jgi:flagellar biosynthetic protein FliR
VPLADAEINVWVGSFLWPLIRIAALMSTAPVFGARTLPRRIRIMLAVVLTGALLPLIPSAAPIEPISPAGLLVAAQQVLIGLVMGFTLRLVFGALEIAGQLIAMQMGLGFANLIDPRNGSVMPVLSHFYDLLGTSLFLALNGHLALIEMLAESFQILPVADTGFAPDSLSVLVGWASQMFGAAVLIALPAVASLMVVNVTFGIMTRASPQLNLFVVGFPISLLFGLLIMLYSLPALLSQLQQLFDDTFQLLWNMLTTGSS